MVEKPLQQGHQRTLEIDFTSKAVQHRLRFGGGRGQDLPKAVGMRKGKTPDIVDATAGLGRDGFLLASLGARVTMIERTDAVFKSLHSALATARAADGIIGDSAARIKLLHGDARQLLPELAPQVVLVDPMHPPRGNSALVKMEMRTLRALVGDDADQVELMQTALACARERVVLKWPRKAPAMPDIPAPSHQIIGKTTRYDVFMT